MGHPDPALVRALLAFTVVLSLARRTLFWLSHQEFGLFLSKGAKLSGMIMHRYSVMRRLRGEALQGSRSLPCPIDAPQREAEPCKSEEPCLPHFNLRETRFLHERWLISNATLP